MSDYRRARIPGGTYFFTIVTFNRRPLFNDILARRCLDETMSEVMARYPLKVEGICLLPDHLHTIWKLPEGDSAYSQRWSAIKGLFSNRYQRLIGEKYTHNLSRQRKGEVSFWHRRFWEHLIDDERDLMRHMDYLHYNPVKHGYVKQVVDWPWSSFHRCVKEGLYPEDWGGSIPAKINLTTVGE